MKWNEVQEHFPHMWLVIEAIESHSEDGFLILDRIAVWEAFPKSEHSDQAMDCYGELHQKFPTRKLFVFHTDREKLDIHERKVLANRPIVESAST